MMLSSSVGWVYDRLGLRHFSGIFMGMRWGWVVLAAVALGVAGAASALAPASDAPILARDLILKNNSANLQYSWRVPPEVGIEPALFHMMRAKAEAGLVAALGQANADAAAAKKSGNPVRQYTDLRYWDVAADTTRLLALTGQVYGYTGGAHGNSGFDTVIWDRKAQAVIGLPSLFTDRAKARAIIEPLVCAELAKEQAARRGGVKAAPEFEKCPPLTQASVVPYGGMAPVAHSVRVIYAPYVAGPYFEGSYEITLPWPDAVKPLVKPEFREALFGVVQ